MFTILCSACIITTIADSTRRDTYSRWLKLQTPHVQARGLLCSTPTVCDSTRSQNQRFATCGLVVCGGTHSRLLWILGNLGLSLVVLLVDTYLTTGYQPYLAKPLTNGAV